MLLVLLLVHAFPRETEMTFLFFWRSLDRLGSGVRIQFSKWSRDFEETPLPFLHSRRTEEVTRRLRAFIKPNGNRELF